MDITQFTELKQFFVVTLDTALAPIRADIKELKEDVAQLKEDVKQLWVEVNQLKKDVRQLQIDVAQIKVDAKLLRQEMYDGFAGVGEALESIHAQDDRQGDLLSQLAKRWKKD